MQHPGSVDGLTGEARAPLRNVARPDDDVAAPAPSDDVGERIGTPLPAHLQGDGADGVERKAGDDRRWAIRQGDEDSAARPEARRGEMRGEGLHTTGKVAVGQADRGGGERGGVGGPCAVREQPIGQERRRWKPRGPGLLCAGTSVAHASEPSISRVR